MTEASSILIVDDEPTALRSFRRTLRSHGFEHVLTCGDSREALGIVRDHRISLLLLDLVMPHVGGEQILAEVSRLAPELPVVVVTAEQEVRAAVRCMKLGAVDYLVKPVETEQLVTTVERALEHSALVYENARLRERFFADRLAKPEAFSEIITSDPAMLRLFGFLEAISRGSYPILITGETGTGKELIARALHRASRSSGPFVAVNVAGLDDAVFADTLFGHRAGAYTGATMKRSGMIEAAGEGTLFLDEIGDLSEASQVKLLRLLQEREYFPLGSDSPSRLRARVVTATHKDPAELRQDLYYRLRSYRVRVPPLRERLSDLPRLLDHFLALAAEDLGKPVPKVPAEVLELLERSRFPGNVRELQALAFEAVARHEEGPLPLEPFRAAVAEESSSPVAVSEGSRLPPPSGTSPGEPGILRREEWRRLERDNLLAALQRANWKVSGVGGAAELLDMKPTTLVSRMKALGIEKPR